MIDFSPDDSTTHVNALPDCDERPVGLPPGLPTLDECGDYRKAYILFIAHYPTADEGEAAFRQWKKEREAAVDESFAVDGTPEQDSGEDDGPDREYIERSREFYDGLGDLNAA